jgi:hypothetical protein
MAFGSIWIKDTYGGFIGWHQGQLYAKTTESSWQPAVHLYEKTAATVWTEKFNADLVPPAAPPLWVNSYDTVNKTTTAVFTAPSTADVTKMCCKISKTGYPTNPGVQDGNGPTTVQADGTPFWLWDTTPGGKSTRRHTGFISGTKYYMSAWAMDASGNWSAPTNYTWTYAYPPAPTKTLTTKTAYVSCTDSASWRSAYGWRTDNNYLYQGGTYNDQGFWFYGTTIATLLKNAYDITSVQIYVQRNSSSHGIAGDGNIMIGHHALTSQPSGSPGTNAVVGEYNAVDLARGEGKWVTLNSAWDTEFKSGSYRGLGVMYSTTSVTSSYYNILYGKGTSSGKLKFTWREYV